MKALVKHVQLRNGEIIKNMLVGRIIDVRYATREERKGRSKNFIYTSTTAYIAGSAWSDAELIFDEKEIDYYKLTH